MFRFISLDCKNIIVNYEQNINQFRSKANGSKKKKVNTKVQLTLNSSVQTTVVLYTILNRTKFILCYKIALYYIHIILHSINNF
jgi:hypothetical protein